MGTIAKNVCDEVATKVATKLHTRFVVRIVRVLLGRMLGFNVSLNVVCIEVLHTTFHGAGYFLLYKARICYFVKIYNNNR